MVPNRPIYVSSISYVLERLNGVFFITWGSQFCIMIIKSRFSSLIVVENGRREVS